MIMMMVVKAVVVVVVCKCIWLCLIQYLDFPPLAIVTHDPAYGKM